MSDIVERLRRRYFSPVAVFRNPDGPEAADEIERLQTKAQKDAREMLAAVENAEAEIERLRAALKTADAACLSYWDWEYGRDGDDIPNASLLVAWRKEYEARAALLEEKP